MNAVTHLLHQKVSQTKTKERTEKTKTKQNRKNKKRIMYTNIGEENRKKSTREEKKKHHLAIFVIFVNCDRLEEVNDWEKN